MTNLSDILREAFMLYEPACDAARFTAVVAVVSAVARRDGWTDEDLQRLREAALTSEALADKQRYNRPLIPQDFIALVTSAKKSRYTYAEALALVAQGVEPERLHVCTYDGEEPVYRLLAAPLPKSREARAALHDAGFMLPTREDLKLLND